MLVLTMAMNIQNYKVFKETLPNKNISELLALTTEKMFWPILYSFNNYNCISFSIFSEIKQVIDFGWMMTLGLITSFIITFTLLPTLISFVPKENISLKKYEGSIITSFFAKYL